MTGRPQASEAAPYYFTYIDQAIGDDPLALLEQQLAESIFGGISEEASLHRYAADKWSIRQVLNHITDTERAFAFRALWFARGFGAPLPGYDQNIAAAGAAADSVSWAAHLEEFCQVRLSTISLPQSASRSMAADRHRERQFLHRARHGLHHCRPRGASLRHPARALSLDFYSLRSVSAGFSRAIRDAGIELASTVATTNPIPTPTSVIGSPGCTPYR
jgi:hypothetical protein